MVGRCLVASVSGHMSLRKYAEKLDSAAPAFLAPRHLFPLAVSGHGRRGTIKSFNASQLTHGAALAAAVQLWQQQQQQPQQQQPQQQQQHVAFIFKFVERALHFSENENKTAKKQQLCVPDRQIPVKQH